MAKSDKAISSGEKTMILAEETLTEDVRKIEEELLKEINKLFNNLTVNNGKIQNSKQATEFLASMEKRIQDALRRSGYNEKVKDFLKNFDSIRRNNIHVHDLVNGATIPYSSLNTVTKLEVENTVSKLLGSGISRDFIIPIRESLYRNIISGASIQDAKKTIEDYILSNDSKDSRLLRYVGQVARDSINQYDGAIQTAIKQELYLPDYLYSGSIIQDSRCQCRYWVNKIKLPGSELGDEIQTALDGGDLGGCSCSGMIPGTNVDNFAINRGGYNCRHRAIAFKID